MLTSAHGSAAPLGLGVTITATVDSERRDPAGPGTVDRGQYRLRNVNAHCGSGGGMDYAAYLDLISERTVGRYDAFALFDDNRVFTQVIEDYVGPFREREIDAVVGIDAIGFVLGTGVALELG